MEKGAKKIPAFETKEEMIKLVNKKSLKRKRPMSSEDEEITLMEVYKRMKRRRMLSTDEIASRKLQKRKRMLRESFIRNRRLISMKKKEKSQEKKNRVPPTKEDEEKKPIPVYELSLECLKLYSDDVVESEEETFGDRERPVEYDFGGKKFVINQDKLTYTRVRHPVKVYYKSHEPRSGCVLYDLNHPVSTVSKKALDCYNAIEGTNYEYVGLVKAYRMPVAGSHYTLRFKARLPDQDPIYFQAMVWQRIPDRKNKVVVLDVHFVHPLPYPISGRRHSTFPLKKPVVRAPSRRALVLSLYFTSQLSM